MEAGRSEMPASRGFSCQRRVMVLAVLLAAVAAGGLLLHGRRQPWVSVVDLRAIPGTGATQVQFGVRGAEAGPAGDLGFVLKVYDRTGRLIGDSLSTPGISGPWVRGMSNPPDSLTYVGAVAYSNTTVLAYSVSPGATPRLWFDVTGKMSGYSEALVYRVQARDLRSARAAESLPSRGVAAALAALARAVKSTGLARRGLLAAACAVPAVLWVLAWLSEPALRAPRPRTLPRVGAPMRWAEGGLALGLVIASTLVFFRHAGTGPAAREPDSFEYFCMAERFGPRLSACIVGMDDRGHDRREFLHQAPDRGWGYPLLLGVLARLADSPDTDRFPLLRRIRAMNTIVLVSTCLLGAALFWRYWTPTALPALRAACVYACLLLDGHNLAFVGVALTEVHSRLLFTAVALSAAAVVSSRALRAQVFWTAAGAGCAYAAMLLRPEHALVEPAVIPAVLLLTALRPGFAARASAWLAVTAVAAAFTVSVSYATYGIVRPTTGTGWHLLDTVCRLPRDGVIHMRDVPPDVRFTPEEREFFERYVIPAGRHPGGASSPYMTLAGAFPELSPLEFTARVQSYTVGIVRRNLDLWRGMIGRLFCAFATRENVVHPAPVFRELGGAMNRFGVTRAFWWWPLYVSAWAFFRWLWGRRYGLPARAAPLLLAIIMLCFLWHAVITVAFACVEVRHKYFVSVYLPLAGALIVWDSAELLLRGLCGGLGLAAARVRGRPPLPLEDAASAPS